MLLCCFICRFNGCWITMKRLMVLVFHVALFTVTTTSTVQRKTLNQWTQLHLENLSDLSSRIFKQDVLEPGTYSLQFKYKDLYSSSIQGYYLECSWPRTDSLTAGVECVRMDRGEQSQHQWKLVPQRSLRGAVTSGGTSKVQSGIWSTAGRGDSGACLALSQIHDPHIFIWCCLWCVFHLKMMYLMPCYAEWAVCYTFCLSYIELCI